jgi:hypothetical protein
MPLAAISARIKSVYRTDDLFKDDEGDIRQRRNYPLWPKRDTRVGLPAQARVIIR